MRHDGVMLTMAEVWAVESEASLLLADRVIENLAVALFTLAAVLAFSMVRSWLRGRAGQQGKPVEEDPAGPLGDDATVPVSASVASAAGRPLTSTATPPQSTSLRPRHAQAASEAKRPGEATRRSARPTAIHARSFAKPRPLNAVGTLRPRAASGSR